MPRAPRISSTLGLIDPTPAAFRAANAIPGLADFNTFTGTIKTGGLHISDETASFGFGYPIGFIGPAPSGSATNYFYTYVPGVGEPGEGIPEMWLQGEWGSFNMRSGVFYGAGTIDLMTGSLGAAWSIGSLSSDTLLLRQDGVALGAMNISAGLNDTRHKFFALGHNITASTAGIVSLAGTGSATGLVFERDYWDSVQGAVTHETYTFSGDGSRNLGINTAQAIEAEITQTGTTVSIVSSGVPEWARHETDGAGTMAANVGQRFRFVDFGAGSTHSLNTVNWYYVKTATATTFTFTASEGGAGAEISATLTTGTTIRRGGWSSAGLHSPVSVTIGEGGPAFSNYDSASSGFVPAFDIINKIAAKSGWLRLQDQGNGANGSNLFTFDKGNGQEVWRLGTNPDGTNPNVFYIRDTGAGGGGSANLQLEYGGKLSVGYPAYHAAVGMLDVNGTVTATDVNSGTFYATSSIASDGTITGDVITGGSITSTGDMSATGTISATAGFTGSGAAISAIDAGNIATGTLAAARGGTGVSNAGTITNAANTTITGGGTLALGGNAFTVPATGTAALLGAAQTLSGVNTFSNATASTAHTNGAVVISGGGLGVLGAINAATGNFGVGTSGQITIAAGAGLTTTGRGQIRAIADATYIIANTAGTNLVRLSASTDKVTILNSATSGTTQGSFEALNFTATGTLSVTGASTLAGALTATPEALAPALNAAAAAGVTTLTSSIAINGANAVSLANGTSGQLKTIVCTAVTAAGTATLTPTTANGFTTVAFTAAGQTLTLQYFTTGGWVILSVRGGNPSLASMTPPDPLWELIQEWWQKTLAAIALLGAALVALRKIWNFAKAAQPFIDAAPKIAEIPGRLDVLQTQIGTMAIEAAINGGILGEHLSRENTGWWVSNEKGQCLVINPVLMEWMGLGDSAAANSGWMEGIHPDDRDRVRTAWDRCIQRTEPFQERYRYFNARTEAATECDVTARWVSTCPASQKMIVGMATKAPGEGRRVLVIEDSEGAAKVMDRHLEKNGATMELATNLGSGMRRLQNGIYDAVLLDLALPDSDAEQTMDELPSIRRAAGRAPLAIVTAQMSQGKIDAHPNRRDANEVAMKHVIFADPHAFSAFFRRLTAPNPH